MKSQFAIYPNRLTMLGGVFVSALFTVAACALLVLFHEDPPLLASVIFCAVFLLCGFPTVSNGIKLTRNYSNPRPELLLDAKGITFFDPDGTPHPVAWEQIAGFRETLITRQTFIPIDVLNPEAVIEAERHRRLMIHNQKYYGAPFTLPPTLKYPRKELLSVLKSFHNKHRPHGQARQ